MEQFKLKVERCLRFDFQRMGDLICLLLGTAMFLFSERSLSFNKVMITLTSGGWSAHIVELASDLTIHSLYEKQSVSQLIWIYI